MVVGVEEGKDLQPDHNQTSPVSFHDFREEERECCQLGSHKVF